MKKTIITILAAISIFGFTATEAQASTWHKGMPKKMRGTWKVPHDKIFHSGAKIGKNYYHFCANDPDYLNNTKYKYLGNKIYKINGYEPVYTKGRVNRYIKLISSKHMKVSFNTNFKKSNSPLTMYKN